MRSVHGRRGRVQGRRSRSPRLRRTGWPRGPPRDLIFNFDDWKEVAGQLGGGLWYVVTHPSELVGADDIAEGKPGRAVADIALLVLPVKALKAARSAKAAEAAAAAKEAAALPEAPRAAKLAEEAAAARAAQAAADLSKRPWEPSPGLRLPAAERGKWTSTPGNPEWIPNDPARFGLKPGEAIPFHQGVPNFRQYAHPTPSGKPGVIEVPGLTGSPKGDYNFAVPRSPSRKRCPRRQYDSGSTRTICRATTTRAGDAASAL